MIPEVSVPGLYRTMFGLEEKGSKQFESVGSSGVYHQETDMIVYLGRFVFLHGVISIFDYSSPFFLNIYNSSCGLSLLWQHMSEKSMNSRGR
jgi:hypothetical protein